MERRASLSGMIRTDLRPADAVSSFCGLLCDYILIRTGFVVFFSAIKLNDSELMLVLLFIRANSWTKTTGVVDNNPWLIYCQSIYSIVVIVTIIYYPQLNMELCDVLFAVQPPPNAWNSNSFSAGHSFPFDSVFSTSRYHVNVLLHETAT